MSAGELVTPNLCLARKLGAGGMGTVWVARHLGLNSDVVVKFITGEHARNAEVVARFQREAASAAEVRSPHVVQMLDHGIASNGLPYIAMELLEGEDLAARVQRQRAMPASEVAGVVLQVAKALSRAHERSIVHRDIKPENIFLCETGEDEAFVKVLDFGIAKVTGAEQLSGTATGAMIGTPYFMSPEQIVGAKSIDFRSDLWSLGVVAFFAMTGARPFDAETLGGLAVQICNGEIPGPSKFNPRLSSAIDAWFLKACARDPAQRFENARAMSEALVAAVGGRSVARVLSKSSPPGAYEDEETRVAMPAMATPSAPLRPVASTDVATAPRPAALASTTGSASINQPGLGTSSAAGVPGRSPAAPLAIAVVVAGLLGVGIFVATRGDATASKAPAASVAKASEPTDEAKGAKPQAMATAQEPIPSAAPAAPTASASVAAKPSPTTPPVTTSKAAAAPSVVPSSSAKKPPTQAAKPKPTDEILE